MTYPSYRSAMRYTTYTNAVMNRPAGRSYLNPHIMSHTARTKQRGDVPQSTSRKAHRTSNIHRIPQHIEREPLHTVVHKNPKVVSQERPSNSKRPGRRHDERLAYKEQQRGYDDVERFGQDSLPRLVFQRSLVSNSRISIRILRQSRGGVTINDVAVLTASLVGCHMRRWTRRGSSIRFVRYHQIAS